MENYKGFYKVEQTNGTYVRATFYNPETNEYFSTCVRDYDYYDGSRDNDELYYMPIDDEACDAFRHANGMFRVGDKVNIVSGRKMVGETKTVADIYDFIPEHCIGWQNRMAYAVEYARFTDGTKCATKHCVYAEARKDLHEVDYMAVKAR